MIIIGVLAISLFISIIQLSRSASSKENTVLTDSWRSIRIPCFWVILENKVSLEEFLNDPKIYEINIYLPTWMPDGIRLVGVYSRPIILLFADREVPDFWHDNITIEISEAPYIPSLYDLKEVSGKYPNIRIIKIGDSYGLLCMNAKTGPPVPYRYSTFIQLWIGNYTYIISMPSHSKLTVDDLVKVAESLKSVRELGKEYVLSLPIYSQSIG